MLFNNISLNKILVILTFSFSFIFITRAQVPVSVDSIPTITTAEITDITPFSAMSGGNVLSDGGSTVRFRGVCWNTTGNPTTTDNKTIDGYGPGSFVSKLTDLKLLTKYFVRAYATNTTGTAYGEEISFETKDTAGYPTAFPGAEGYGKYTTGGRGGRVLEVTNLNDSGPGSLRDAISKNFPRIIVFKISGTIFLNSTLSIKYGDITIAGQTAPGDGICIAGYTLTVDADNVIIRYIRSRHGDIDPSQDDAMNGTNHKNIIIDHCSMTWSVDECASFYDNANFTMQWCIVGESLFHSIHEKGDHGYGGIEGGWGATFHHNLYINNSSRNPRFCGARYHHSTANLEIVDFVNNLIYNWGFNSVYGGEMGQQNVRANYYKPGPATGSSVRNRILNPTQDPGTNSTWGKFYVADNYVEGYPNTAADNWGTGVQGVPQTIKDTIKVDQPFPIAPVKTEPAEDVFETVLDNVGANYPKLDSVDARLVHEARTGVATYEGIYKTVHSVPDPSLISGIIDSQSEVGGWPVLKSTAAPPDSDHDGMPDAWELSHNLNPYDSSDASLVDASGYTMIEEYINGLVSPVTSVKDIRQVPVTFSLEQNYPNPFNPSTKIEFSIPVKTKVKLEIFDILGRKISTLADGEESAGSHSVDFNAYNLSSGVYIYKLSSPNKILSRKMILLK